MALKTGRFLSVKFVKRTNGSVRKMTVRGGVRKGVKESTPEERKKRLTADKNQGLIRAYMVGEPGYGFRSFGVDRLISISINGETLVSENSNQILKGGCVDV